MEMQQFCCVLAGMSYSLQIKIDTWQKLILQVVPALASLCSPEARMHLYK